MKGQRVIRPERRGVMHWVLPAMLLLVATGVVLSGRDLSQVYAELATGGNGMQHPLMPWLQRGVSLFLVLAAGERILHHLATDRPVPSAVLAWAYGAYWGGTVLTSAVFGTHREIAHEFVYPLVIGMGAVLVTSDEAPRLIERARDALFLLMLISVVLIPIAPDMVLDASYTQGLIPGLPRLGGVAPHPVALGMFAQTGLLLLWSNPYKRRWLTVLAWVLGAGVLFMAQSKTAWIAFLACSLTMALVRGGGNAWRRMGDPREGSFGIVVCLCAMCVGAALLGLLLIGDIGDTLSRFFDTDQGAQLMSMTGRDQIWTIAWEEWHANPVFGYGPSLWDDDFRASINMPNATSAHNQFMDTLARSGTVGAVFLVAYAAVLLVLSIRYARQTRGLSLALFLALAMRSVSEVPLLALGYGTELFMHLLLVAVLASAASSHRTVQAPVRRRAPLGVAT